MEDAIEFFFYLFCYCVIGVIIGVFKVLWEVIDMGGEEFSAVILSGIVFITWPISYPYWLIWGRKSQLKYYLGDNWKSFKPMSFSRACIEIFLNK